MGARPLLRPARRRQAGETAHAESTRFESRFTSTQPELDRDAWPRYLRGTEPAVPPAAGQAVVAGRPASAWAPPRQIDANAAARAEGAHPPSDSAPPPVAPRLPPPPASAHPPKVVVRTDEPDLAARVEGPAGAQAETPPAAPGEGEDMPGKETAKEGSADGKREDGAAGSGAAWEEPEEAADGESGAAEPLPTELVAADAAPITPPPPRWQPLAADWPLPAELGAAELPRPPAAAPVSPAKGEDKGQGPDKGAATRPAGDDPAEARRQGQAAAETARQAWRETSIAARHAQQAFVERANQAIEAMAAGHARHAGEVRPALDMDLAAVDAAAALAAEQIKNAADLALLQLEGASQTARQAIARAGSNAYGLINAGAVRATAGIATVVSQLVAGHKAAYNDAIADARAAADAALLALNDWRDQRTVNYPIDGGAMLGAKNESLQSRIPRWTDPEATRLNQRADAKKKAWSSSRDSTVCSLTSGYRGGLEAENCQAAAQTRDSVARALREARTSLRAQTRDGRKALKDLRRSSLERIATQRQATKSRLTGQTRATLWALRGEAQGAIHGVRGAASSAIPGYWRGADGLRQSLRGVADRGPPAVERTAKKAPDGILAGLRRGTAALDGRLAGNREQLERGLAERVAGHRLESAVQRDQLILALQQQGNEAGRSFDQASAGFVEAFAGLAQTVLNAAAAWAQPTAKRMAASIRAKQGEARQALDGLLYGQSGGGADGGGGGAAPGAGGGTGRCAAASRGDCAKATGGSESSDPQGLLAQVDEELDYYDERLTPDTFFASQITTSDSQVEESLRTRAVNVAGKFEGGFAGSVDETGVIAALRGLTTAKGRALDLDAYPTASGRGSLDSDLRHYLGANSGDYATAHAYLTGNAEEGARRELADSTGFFNDDEARIEATMRALSPEQSAALGAAHPEVMADIRDALGGTDLEVFNALAAGNHARADAYRLRDAVDEARRDGNADAVHSAIEQYTGAPREGDWRAAEEVDAEANRAAVVRELGGIVGEVAGATSTDAEGRPLAADQLAVERAVAYVSRDIEVYVGGAGPEGEPQTVTMRLTGANRDLAGALLRHGPDSVQARVARLGVEMQRSGDPPNPLNIDRAMFDSRFTPDNPNATLEERQANERARAAARADRERVLLLAAQNYAGDSTRLNTSHDPDAVMAQDYQADPAQVDNARQALIDGMRGRFGSDTLGGDLAAGLLTDERPSPRTAALAMRHAQAGCGTNEELLFRFTERMNRDEIAAMRSEYQSQTGRSLDADLGTYGEGGTFTELSGDDRLRMERALRGVARTDQERLENAAFAITQQRRETGAFGAWLAEGSLAEQVMNNTEAQLQTLAGGPIRFNAHGELNSSLANFSPTGEYTGLDRDHFRATTAVAQTVAQNYSARIDAYADVATTGLAILGAIAAAVITVATGGAAAPLIAAALITGLASMSANYAIKGGRYGWEQAAIDLGMTAVQALTAGVGAQLGAAAQVASKGAAAASTASRSLVTLSRLFTGNPVVDQIIVGAITGGIGGLGGAAFDERTWERGGDDAVGTLFAGLLKGALSGAATAAITNSIEQVARNGAQVRDAALRAGTRAGLGSRIAGGVNDMLSAGTGGDTVRSARAMLGRGLARGGISSLGAMGGRGTELAVDATRGKYRGDLGEALGEMGHAGLRAFVQGIGEGAGEAAGQGMHARRLRAAADDIARERAERGLEPLAPHALETAADDLLFLDRHGRNGNDGLGRALNLDHIATHGGLAASVATRFPEPFVEDGMRAALLRHVPEAERAEFADVPIRVMAEAEYHALTRSQSGPVVTLVEHGQPVVVIREGTPIARLADEGPHLQQTRDAHTRERAARLDEATLARWDSLDLDTQITLYRDKIELEIDAHQRIADSLAAEQARGGGDTGHLAAEIERNATTLRNLHERLVDVEALGPAQRTAIAEGDQPRPQYLEQPARLFSKEARPSAEAEATARRPTGEEDEETRIRHGSGPPDLRGPRLKGEPGSEADLRQRHEDWMEGLRRGHLQPGSQLPMAEGAQPTRFMSMHDSPEAAYAAYDATVRAHRGSREVGIVRDAVSGRYMVVLGSPTGIRYPNELARPETMLHYHPDYGPSLYRGPSGTDLASAAATARATGRPATEFIEYDVPGVGRGRTAFTLTPVPDATVPGGVRLRIDIEYVDPATGQYVHQRFASRQEWSEHYHGRTTWLDPDGPVYLDIMRTTKATEARIEAVAAGHREPGAPPPVREPAPAGRPHQAIVGDEPPAPPGRRRPEADIESTRLTEIAEKRRMAPERAREHVEESDASLPERPPEGHAQGDRRGRLFPETAEQRSEREARLESGNAFNREEALRQPYNEVALAIPEGSRGYPRVDSYVPGEAIISRKQTQLAEIGDDLAIAHLVELAERYPPGSRIADVPGNQALLAECRARFGARGEFLLGRLELHIPPQEAPISRAVLETAQRAGIVIRDSDGRVYSLAAPDGGRRLARASANDPEAQSAGMRRALLRDVPPELRADVAAADIIVLPAAAYGRLPNARDKGVSVLELKGSRTVVIREGTPITHLSGVGAELAESSPRAHLLRHVPPEQRARFTDTPVRILPEAEYLALARDESGPVLILVENGRPVVVIREGTAATRLAEEGARLMQAIPRVWSDGHVIIITDGQLAERPIPR
ncbi:MAG TPA: hypothetical protein PKH69_02870 [Thiobacillaceae bacterium]|nr:hypothetical protein [Thiobacillaceae bacterium]HNU63029.1 hypothetical protein [Thiobacillaceae bacterium]